MEETSGPTAHTFLVSASPHIRGPETVPRIMWTVAAALAPAGFVALYNFGYYAAVVAGLSICTAVLTEWVIQKWRGVEVTVHDGSAFVTGLLLAYVLPPNVPWYVPVVGSAFAIGVVKHAFGGLGMNIWNPALAGRAFVLAAFSGLMVLASKWVMLKPDCRGPLGNICNPVHALTQASPLVVMHEGGPGPQQIIQNLAEKGYTLWTMFVGPNPGSLGETSALALLIGAALLVCCKIIDYALPLAYIATVAVLVVLLPHTGATDTSQISNRIALVPYHVLGGGLILGAFFMATDMVTSPMTRLGAVIFAAGCGILTVVIRLYGGYPEGVCYSILIMNTAVPLIDRWTPDNSR